MAGLRKEYDYIFIDCPPVEIVADAAIISKLADMTLFIVRAGLLDQSMLPEIEKFYTDKNTGTCRLSSMERTVEADVTGINMDISTATTTGMPAIQKRNNQKCGLSQSVPALPIAVSSVDSPTGTATCFPVWMMVCRQWRNPCKSSPL